MADNVLGGETLPRRIFGVRAAALAETTLFLIAALAADHLFGAGDRLASIQPHPFWIAVLLSASYYGTAEGLAAATLASAALLAGNMPEPAAGQDLPAWLLDLSRLPVLWFTAALVIGGIRSAHRRDVEDLRRGLAQAKGQADVIAQAYDRLSAVKDSLEERVAAQGLTLRRLAEAAASLDGPDAAAVLAASADFARAVLPAGQAVVYRAEGGALVPAAWSGLAPGEPKPRRIERGPLCAAVLERREALSAADPAEEAILDGLALIAVPLVGPKAGAVHGMLALRAIAFRDFTPAALLDARAAAMWIGRALDRAPRAREAASMGTALPKAAPARRARAAGR